MGRKAQEGISIGLHAELRKILSKRLIDEGWNNIKHFADKSGILYSLETVRRAFNNCEYKNLSCPTLAVIMKYLGYSPYEIKKLLMTYTDDNIDLVDLIGVSKRDLTIKEEKVLEAYRIITKDRPELSTILADQFDFVGKIANVDTKNITDVFRRH